MVTNTWEGSGGWWQGFHNSLKVHLRCSKHNSSRYNCCKIGGCVPSPTKTSISSVHYMLVSDINGLLCDAQHVLIPKSWKLLFVPVWCGYKMVSPGLGYYEFLTLCSSRFNIGIWSSTTKPNLILMVDLLLGERSEIKLVFVCGNEKCDRILVCHPNNNSRALMLKNMNKGVWWDKPLLQKVYHNILLIDDCPYKCMGNVPFFYIMLHPFNSEVDDDKYILGTLWPWLVGLFNALSTIAYVGSHHHGQKHVNKQNPHWKALRTYAHGCLRPRWLATNFKPRHFFVSNYYVIELQLWYTIVKLICKFI
jgi:hypothetical protein